MHKKDSTKLIVAIILFATIGIAYFIDGKSFMTKTIVAVSSIIWVITLYFTNKSKK